MGFLISKLAWALLAPGTLLLLVLAGALLWHSRRPRLSRGLLLGALLFLALLALTPLSHWAISPLERRFPLPGALPHVDGIITLGGAIDDDPTGDPEVPALNDGAERVTAFVTLARRYPEAKLVFTGGSGSVRDQDTKEADLARPLFRSLGVPPERVIYERQSRNTWENAVYSRKLAQPKPGETWLLVTSAWHMPRSVGCFRRAGWNVVPYPVDYRGNAPQWAALEMADELHNLGAAEREWIGLIAYRLMGRSDALFPAP